MAAAVAVSHLPSHSPRRALASWLPAKRPFMEPRDPGPTSRPASHSSPPSRTRRERPCDGCRRRKSKCVPQESRRCILCEFHKQECTFVEEAQPRKRKADTGPEHDGSMRKKTLPALQQSPLPPQRPLTPTPVNRQMQPSIASAQAPLVSHAAGRPEPRLFAVDETLGLQRNRHCKYLGPTTTLDAALVGLGDFDDKNETELALGTLRKVTDSEYFIIHDDVEVPIPDEARALTEIDDIVGPHGPTLIDIYFQKVHASYPIIQKEAFLDRHRHGDRQFNPPLLAAMYLLALAWWHTDPVVAGTPRPDIARLEYVAITSLTVAMQRPKISAVQAGLLLLQRAKASTWTLTVQLVALGQDIGLHLDCTDWSIPPWERRLRKRLAWALYMQDKWSAVVYGRPSHIDLADWNVPEPTADDFDETIEPQHCRTPEDEDSRAADAQTVRGRMAFMQMIALTNIVADVHETFYSGRAKAEYARAGRYATQLVLSRAKPVQIRLKHWFANLPPECKMDGSPPATTPPFPDQLIGQGYLHLAYFATEISIHRRIVQSLADAFTSPAGPHTYTTATTAAKPDPYILYICRSAAKTRLISALDFTNRLKPAHLEDFWFFASANSFALIATFGALLQATSPGHEEAEFYAARLREFRWTLAVSSKKAPWITASVRVLDADVEMLLGAPARPSGLSASSSRRAVTADQTRVQFAPPVDGHAAPANGPDDDNDHAYLLDAPPAHHRFASPSTRQLYPARLGMHYNDHDTNSNSNDLDDEDEDDDDDDADVDDFEIDDDGSLNDIDDRTHAPLPPQPPDTTARANEAAFGAWRIPAQHAPAREHENNEPEHEHERMDLH